MAATTKRIDNEGIIEYVRATVADITYYVTTAGLDTNDGLTVPTALLTIQAAINKVPKIVKHKVTIEVGAGNFGAFRVSGFSLSTWVGDGADYQFTIRGAAFIAWTPATGLGSGTSTGGTTNTLIDAGGGWTAHNLRGKWVYVNSEWLIIRDNDATSFETIGISASTMSGKVYVIQDHSTFINTKILYASHGLPGASGTATYVCIGLDNNTGNRNADTNAIHITRMQLNGPSGTSNAIRSETSESSFSYISTVGILGSIFVVNCFNVFMKHMYFGGTGTAGTQITGVQRAASFSNIFAYNKSTAGILFGQVNEVRSATYLYADYCGIGIWAQYSIAVGLSNCYASYCTGSGINTYGTSNTSISTAVLNNNAIGLIINTDTVPASNTNIYGPCAVTLGGVVISDSTSHAVVIGGNCSARFTTLTGTGNGGYGVYAKLGAKAFITSGTTVTGVGDVKVGTTVASYAADFVADQSYVADLSEGTIVKRSDTISFP